MTVPRAFIAAALLLLLLAGPAAAKRVGSGTYSICEQSAEAQKYCGANARSFPCTVSPEPYIMCVSAR